MLNDTKLSTLPSSSLPPCLCMKHREQTAFLKLCVGNSAPFSIVCQVAIAIKHIWWQTLTKDPAVVSIDAKTKHKRIRPSNTW